MFFEGAEKKIEINISKNCKSLREKGMQYWQEVVKACHATILSSVSNDTVDAFLLSESSLFVWDDRILMLTCGQTRLIQSILMFLEEYHPKVIESLIFQRKNEFRSHEQYSSFRCDVEKLESFFSGDVKELGIKNGHYHEIYCLKKEFGPSFVDRTTELLMYDMGEEAMAIFTNPDSNNSEDIVNFLGIDCLLPDFKRDDYCFNPYGYSLNGIKDGHYYTIHVTPQKVGAYMSFETNIIDDNKVKSIVLHFLSVLNPKAFDLINYDRDVGLNFKEDDVYRCEQRFTDRLCCGYNVNFETFFKNEMSLNNQNQLEV